MQVTILDLAVAANTVYNFQKGRGNNATAFTKTELLDRAPADYQVIFTHEDTTVGFFGAVYKHGKSNQYIVSYRGTAVSSSTSGQMVGGKNLKTDNGLYAIESLPSCVRAAHLLLEQAKILLDDAKPILCGHSLDKVVANIKSSKYASMPFFDLVG